MKFHMNESEMAVSSTEDELVENEDRDTSTYPKIFWMI